MKIMPVIDTRPETIKLATVILVSWRELHLGNGFLDICYAHLF